MEVIQKEMLSSFMNMGLEICISFKPYSRDHSGYVIYSQTDRAIF